MQNQFIVIDGPDGSGKKTQTKLLQEYFEKLGRDVFAIDFPRYDNNYCGSIIKDCLMGKYGDFLALDPKITSTFFAMDRFESSAEIRKRLKNGEIVISDRYVSANEIHQASKIKDEEKRDEFIDWLEHLEFDVFGIPRPDVILYLHIPFEISKELVAQRALDLGIEIDEAERNFMHQKLSRENALSAIERGNNWIKIDCVGKDGQLKSKEEIHKLIRRELSL